MLCYMLCYKLFEKLNLSKKMDSHESSSDNESSDNESSHDSTSDGEVLEISKNFKYIYDDDEESLASDLQPNDFNLHNLMQHRDVYTHTLQQLAGNDLLSACLVNPQTYEICSNQHFWKTKLEQEGIVLYHEYEHTDYKYYYTVLYFCKYIIDIELIDFETDYLVFRIKKGVKLNVFIQLMLFLGINVDDFVHTQKKEEFNEDFDTMYDSYKNKTVYYIDMWYKPSKNNFGITLGFNDHANEDYNIDKISFISLSYDQLLNFMFNAYVERVIYEIAKNYD